MQTLRSTDTDLRNAHAVLIEDIHHEIDKNLCDPMESIYEDIEIRIAYFRRAKKLRAMATPDALEELAMDGFTRFGKTKLPLP